MALMLAQLRVHSIFCVGYDTPKQWWSNHSLPAGLPAWLTGVTRLLFLFPQGGFQWTIPRVPRREWPDIR